MRFHRRSVPFANSPRYQNELLSMLNDLVGNLAEIFDRHVGLTDNLDCAQIAFTSNAIADTEDAVTHGLKRVPIGFIVTSLNKGAVVYLGTTPFSAAQIFLRTNTASVAVKALVF